MVPVISKAILNIIYGPFPMIFLLVDSWGVIFILIVIRCSDAVILAVLIKVYSVQLGLNPLYTHQGIGLCCWRGQTDIKVLFLTTVTEV